MFVLLSFSHALELELTDILGWEFDHTGKLRFREHRIAGLENLAQGFVDLLQGKNEGKSVVVVAED